MVGTAGDKIRVLVVDDDDEIQSVLAIFLGLHELGFEIVGSVGRAGDALSYAKYQRPDVVVLDLALAGVAGLEVAEYLLERQPDLPIVVYSGHLHPSMVAEAERIGIRECVDKSDIGRLATALAAHSGASRFDG